MYDCTGTPGSKIFLQKTTGEQRKNYLGIQGGENRHSLLIDRLSASSGAAWNEWTG
jgi:hypothetical protein